MSKSIDIRMAHPYGMKAEAFEKALGIVEKALTKEYPDALIRIRKSTSMNEVSVFGFGKEGKAEVDAFLEALFNDSYLFEDL
ncbi:DinI family protein [Pasteurellaceae bacterium RH1A]|nr:DinI family protein [Pasteurellaceae bacterium RH1A]